mmetsp:Transcript_11450/g.44512  ORF Transcript_11450/g.44512 Transcript_11450/m.44512 type:complete len:419 (-) Transcript_11450:520-1776(-)
MFVRLRLSESFSSVVIGAQMVRVCRFKSSSWRRSLSNSAIRPAHRISSLARRLRAFISSLFFSAHSFSTVMPSSTSFARSAMASQRCAQKPSSATAMTCTSISGLGVNVLAFVKTNDTSAWTSSAHAYTPPFRMLASTVPRSIGRSITSGYVGRFSATWSTGLLNGCAHLCAMSCFNAARHCRFTTSSLRFAATAANAAESHSGAAKPPLRATLPGALSRTLRPAKCVLRLVSARSASVAASSASSLRSSRSLAERTASAATRSMAHDSSANLRLALSRCSRSWCRLAASCAGVSSFRVKSAARSASALARCCFKRAAAWACARLTMALTTGSCSGSNENAGRCAEGADADRVSPPGTVACARGMNEQTSAPTQHAHTAVLVRPGLPFIALSGTDGTKSGADSMRGIAGDRPRPPCCL